MATGANVAPAPSLVAGTRLGKYELVDRLAVGGMAEIYLARSEGPHGFEKHVVLKRIHAHLAADEEFTRKFLDEARLAATLQHTNVVQVFDYGEVDGRSFIIMEFVHGEDVRRMLRKSAELKRTFTVESALAIVTGATAGLHHAHEQVGEDGEPLSLVHRDVSPANILVGFDGVVKVTDFGIAKARIGEQTTTGSLKGKVAHMSPEQCRGEPLDRRSDVFALGVVLWELTTGRRLFVAESEYGLIHKIVNEDAPPPTSIHPTYPQQLEAIVLRALRRNREERQATMAELQAELEQFGAQQGYRLMPSTLAATMEELFGKRELPWRLRTPAPAEERPASPAPMPQPGAVPIVVAPRAPAPAPAPVPVAVPAAVAAPLEEPPPRRMWPFALLGAAAGLVVASFLWLRSPTVTSAPPPPAPAAQPKVESAVVPPPTPSSPPGLDVAPPTPEPTPQAPVLTSSEPPPRPVARRPPRKPAKPAAKPKPATAQRDPNLPFLPAE